MKGIYLRQVGQSVGEVELSWRVGLGIFWLDFSVSVKLYLSHFSEPVLDCMVFGTSARKSNISHKSICRWSWQRRSWWWRSRCEGWWWSCAWLDLADYRVPEDQRRRRLLTAGQTLQTLWTGHTSRDTSVDGHLYLCATYWHYGRLCEHCVSFADTRLKYSHRTNCTTLFRSTAACCTPN